MFPDFPCQVDSDFLYIIKYKIFLLKNIHKKIVIPHEFHLSFNLHPLVLTCFNIKVWHKSRFLSPHLVLQFNDLHQVDVLVLGTETISQ